MPALYAFVMIDSEKTIEEIGSIISAAVTGGVPFGGKEDAIYDEVPAIYALADILASRFVLQGTPEDGYALTVQPRRSPREPTLEIDIGALVAELLEKAGLQAEWEPFRITS